MNGIKKVEKFLGNEAKEKEFEALKKEFTEGRSSWREEYKLSQVWVLGSCSY